jgi:hypothetical protein
LLHSLARRTSKDLRCKKVDRTSTVNIAQSTGYSMKQVMVNYYGWKAHMNKLNAWEKREYGDSMLAERKGRKRSYYYKS